MEFRETTEVDLAYMSESKSRGIQTKSPDRTDYVYTLENGKPIMIGGFRLVNLTTAWCWVDVLSHEDIRVSYRLIKEWIDDFAQVHKLKRLQAYVECDFDEAIRMVKHLGFEKESIMKNFMGDKDAYMFARIL